MSPFLTKGRNRSSAFAFLPLRRQDINFERGVIIVARNLTRFGEGLPKTPYGEREVDMLEPVRAARAEQQARVELKSTFLFYETRGGPLSLKVVRGGVVQAASPRTVARAASLPVPAHLCHIASFRGAESALRGPPDRSLDGSDGCPSLRAMDAQAAR